MSVKEVLHKRLTYLLFSVVCILLTGCSGHNQNASSLAKELARNISQSLPVQSAGYTLAFARSSGSTVTLTVISEAGTQPILTPEKFLWNFQQQMCADPSVVNMISRGILYEIMINDISSGSSYQSKLNRTTCRI
ncbi:TPA: type II secretion system pilot lipoprotein GspS-beta [Escherichia coli]|uniref:type II secretion system pilot lipoprotein GspS-beta n=1 Tax=Escherichia TaxID=561 RepID=UPI00090723AB|nr:type II secretion system pilot lipoprotein GspS-beta [Escherichia ruysiae]HAL9679574.1 type II secretion system pilot lipoprotein GspS-beta [Escherichia coli]HBC1284241.1 type II secretion system pilot lipoprotein GspS-beta [Escherichia coli]